jgi:uncharacterized membrane protein YdjX (TVP38/TMEM64 family)
MYEVKNMKKLGKVLIIVVWVAIIYAFFKLNLLNGDMNKLSDFLKNHGEYKTLLFIALSTFRVLALIPSAVFMILGGIMFTPMQGFFLTLISVILSETIIFILSKVMLAAKVQEYLVNKYPKVYKLLLRNNTRILALGILCPLAPSDVACFLASSTGIKYGKFMVTVVIANIPMAILYSFLGDSVTSSLNNSLIIGSIVLVISCYSIYLWNREQKQYKIV